MHFGRQEFKVSSIILYLFNLDGEYYLLSARDIIDCCKVYAT